MAFWTLGVQLEGLTMASNIHMIYGLLLVVSSPPFCSSLPLFQPPWTTFSSSILPRSFPPRPLCWVCSPPRSSCGSLSLIHSVLVQMLPSSLAPLSEVTPLSHGTLYSLTFLYFFLMLLLITTEYRVCSLFLYRFSFLFSRMEGFEGKNLFIVVMSRRMSRT